MIVVFFFSLYASSQVCLWIEDELSIEGNWCMALAPLHCAITLAIV